ncbi:hypothetical protein ABE10_00720, partial [Bacillus toyonensis]|nr:hypothetical protein [Bacillus toyonensis]
RDELDVGGLVVDACLLQRAADGDQVGGLGDDLEALGVGLDLLGARLEDRHHHVVLGRALGADDDHALAREVVRDAARVSERSAVPAECGAHLGRRSILVVGEALDEQRHPVRAVALVHDRGVLDRLAADAGSALDRTVDVVLRDRGLLRLEDGVEERRVALQVGAAELRRDLDVLDELGPRLRTTRVDDGLLVLRGRPFGVPGHMSPLVSLAPAAERASSILRPASSAPSHTRARA